MTNAKLNVPLPKNEPVLGFAPGSPERDAIQKHLGEMEERTVCTFRQHFNPFVMKISVDFSGDEDEMLDRRLGIAAGILLCAIEGKQGR